MIKPLSALTARERDLWLELRAANPALDSPYFHPGFAEAVQASGRDVQVVVGDGVLMPVHRDGSLLRPVGWPGADFQGPIRAPDTPFAPLSLLSAGARGFAFDHLLAPCAEFEPWMESSRDSPLVDVTGGLDGYLGRASRSGKDNLGQARRRAAKAERELGPLRFTAESVDTGDLDRVVELKRAQYAATGARDYFVEPDRRALLDGLLKVRDTEFGGILSTVYAGPHLLAAHFGLRADHVLHWWFPVYDPEFGQLAPGWILLRELIMAGPALGITRIDLGRGDDEYKRRAKTGDATVCQGLVTRSSMRQSLRKARNSAVAAVKSSPLAPGLRRLIHAARASKG